MKIKSNVRAGSGGASGSGQNSKSKSGISTDSVNSTEINNTVGLYIPPVSRCVGI